MGKVSGRVGGHGVSLPMTLPTGVRYNPEIISIETFRKMTNDYQLAACLNVMAFTIQKIDWYFVDGRKEVRDFLDYSLSKVWNRLIKSIAKSFWAGYSPCTKVFEYDTQIKKINLKKIRDLAPETCRVNVDEYGEFTGFTQFAGQSNEETISPKYAFWYPNQMIDGDLYGRSMLKPAYNPWYFSELIHLFANRYYERFGEPAVKGRAPNETLKDKDGNTKEAIEVIQAIAESLKSNSAFTIPAVYDENGNLLYDITYLESGMRGVDFNTYLNRLDMEKARAVFIPDLLFGTGRVGSYELGKEHKATFLTGLMGMMDDMSEYIQKYIANQLVEINYGTQEKIPQFTYLPLSQINQDLLVNVISQVVRGDPTILDIQKLAAKLGVPLRDAEEVAIERKKAGSEEPMPPDNQPTPKEKDQNIQKQPAIKKQLERVSHYVENVFHSKENNDEKLMALEATKIGYPEHFTPENYLIREKRVRTYLVGCFQEQKSLEETLSGLGEMIGTQDKESYIMEEAQKLKDKIERLS